MMRMRGQPREPDLFDLRLLLQPLGEQQRIAAVALHTQRQGTNTAQRQEAAERIENAANRVLQIAQLFRQRGVVADHRQPGDHIGVAVEVFGRRVHHDIEAQLQRTMDSRRGEGVVGDADNIVPPGNGGDSAEVCQLKQRVGRRFDPDHARIGPNGRFDGRQIVGLHPAHPQAGAAAANVFNQPVCAAVDIVDGDQVAIFIQQLQHG